MLRCEGTRSPASPAVVLALRTATQRRHHPEHREIRAAACQNPCSGDGLLAVQSGTLEGLKPALRVLPLGVANVAVGSKRRNTPFDQMWSALPPTTDMMRLHRYIGFVAKPGSDRGYSIT